jgi:hypothetical protein
MAAKEKRTEMTRLRPGLSFSLSRALGISAAKARISRRLGVPLSRSGRERKVGRMVMQSGEFGIWLLIALAVSQCSGPTKADEDVHSRGLAIGTRAAFRACRDTAPNMTGDMESMKRAIEATVACEAKLKKQEPK